MDDLIGRALRSGLLESVGDDTERVEYLRSAAAGVATMLRENPNRLPHALLTALYEDGPETAPALEEARAAILDEWETFEHAFPDTPLELFRIVLLDAVDQARQGDEKLAAVTWYLLRTGIELLPVASWDHILEDFLKSLDDAVRDEINRTWVIDPNIPMVRMPSVPDATFTAASLGELKGKSLKTKTKNAFSKKSNASQIVQQLPTILTEIIDRSKQDLSKLDREGQERLKEVVSEIGKKVRKALEAQENLLNTNARRTNLLWWKETGWSSHRGSPYGSFEKLGDIMVVAPLDLQAIVPSIVPEVVEHVLAQVVNRTFEISEEGIDNVAFEDFASAADGAIQRSDRTEQDGLVPLLEVALRSSVQSEMPSSTPDAFLTSRLPGEYAVIAFRDLQVRRLLDE